jgi:hypothetical protein
MKTFGALLAAIVIPIMLLNMFGEIVAGIWLAILGEWSAIFLGIAILVVGAFAVSFLLAPGLGLLGIGAMALERGNKFVGWFLILLASPWTYIVVIVWELVIFNMFGKRVTADNVIPMWLWSYGAATGVWSYMASQEQQSGDGGRVAAGAAFSAQVAYIALAVCRIWLDWPLVQTVIAMAVPLLLQIAVSLLAIGESSRRYA